MRYLLRVLGIMTVSGIASLAPATDACAREPDSDPDLPRLHMVDPGLWRGAQPTRRGIQELKEKGIKTMINFRTNKSAVQEEIDYARKIGIKDVAMPISGNKGPTNEQIDEFFAIVRDEQAKPVFIHCDAGRDRTGVLTSLYREQVQNWSPSKAYAEMTDLGFRKSFMWLSDSLYDFRKDDGHLHPPTAKTKMYRTAKFIAWFPVILFDVVRIQLHPPHNHLK